MISARGDQSRGAPVRRRTLGGTGVSPTHGSATGVPYCVITGTMPAQAVVGASGSPAPPQRCFMIHEPGSMGRAKTVVAATSRWV